jgi:hypothetical protein
MKCLVINKLLEFGALASLFSKKKKEAAPVVRQLHPFKN